MKSKHLSSSVEDRVKASPTVYVFDLNDVPVEKYASALDVLFHNPDFSQAVEKRNRLVKSADRMVSGSAQIQSVIRTIMQHDRRLADMVYSTIVQANLHSTEGYDFVSFSHLLRYFVDYSRDGMDEMVSTLSANLNKMTFLADMIESVVVDIKSDMTRVFGGEFEFRQFDAVCQVLAQLRGYFKMLDGKEGQKSLDLYYEYSDSINEYLDKRLKTFSDKYKKICPRPTVYTEQDMIKAMNQFFEVEDKFGPHYIKHTPSGGCYIDAVTLAFNITPEQAAAMDKYVGAVHDKRTDTLNYCLKVTDVIMHNYKK